MWVPCICPKLKPTKLAQRGKEEVGNFKAGDLFCSSPRSVECQYHHQEGLPSPTESCLCICTIYFHNSLLLRLEVKHRFGLGGKILEVKYTEAIRLEGVSSKVCNPSTKKVGQSLNHHFLSSFIYFNNLIDTLWTRHSSRKISEWLVTAKSLVQRKCGGTPRKWNAKDIQT